MRRSGLVVVALVALLCGGCLESKPPAKSYAASDAGFAPAPARDASCGDATGGASVVDGSDAESPDAAAPPSGGGAAWAGTWTFTTGSQGILCGGTLSVVAVSGILTITPSPAGDALTVVEDGCSFHFDVMCGVAISAPGQACAAWSVPTIPLWTLTLEPDGTLKETLGGRVVVGADVCTISGGSTLSRQ